MSPAPRCSECGQDCDVGRAIYVLEIVLPDPAPSRVVQLCSSKCVTAWLAGYEGQRAALKRWSDG